jgi:hypothetical protein
VPSRAEWESARVVAEDLEYLANGWVPTFDKAVLRRDSPILRRLLVEGQYPRVWMDLGLPDEPYVSAPDFDAALGNVSREYLQYALAPVAPEVGVLMASALPSGFDVKRVQLKVIQDVPEGWLVAVPEEYPRRLGAALVAIPPDVVQAAGDEQAALQQHVQFGEHKVRAVRLSDYLRSPAAIILGVEVSRSDVIRYVANKLGGAHFDPDRSRKGDDRLALLDQELAVIVPGTKAGINNVYAELLTVAQVVGESGDAARLRAAFASTAEPAA